MKICTKCKLEKDDDQFYVDKKTSKPYSSCKECGKKRTIKYFTDTNYYVENKTRILTNGYSKHKEKMASDPLYKLKHNLRASVNNILKSKGFKKEIKTNEILGCSYEFFHKHMEDQFEPWMNWNNKGDINGICKNINETWDIDHIIPISSVSTYEEVIKLSHYSNLRPLCSYTNRYIKRNNITD